MVAQVQQYSIATEIEIKSTSKNETWFQFRPQSLENEQPKN
jgi:hypothetical protein